MARSPESNEIAREGAAPPTSGCRPDVILFHQQAWIKNGRSTGTCTPLCWLKAGCFAV